MNDKTSNKRNVTDPVGVTPPASMVPNGRGRGKNNTRAPLLLARARPRVIQSDNFGASNW
ncbi:hypothetical protein T02_10143 [Trichinella nativa]|uniref:Uncharacterized protein n=1 Tax=Trichinella nativa TaxID=6335 RepID=A0A0V1LI21_9BILA|nr:hypothetical protein T02_10143 [Trichinella nativa]